MRDYILAVGGTGARCLEAITHLAAAGLFNKPLHVLIVDPSDQNNGNGRIARQLLERYEALNSREQPRKPRSRQKFARRDLDGPKLFQVPINHSGPDNVTPQPYAWRNPNSPNRKFEQAIDFTRQSKDFQDFLRLFYSTDDLDMTLNVGYRARTSVGAAALKIDLDSTRNQTGGGLTEFIANLQQDLQNGYPKVFVAGSVFGGTGASALPTLPAFIRNLDTSLIGPNAERVRYGSAMLIPYFDFPKASEDQTTGPTPDPDEQMMATKAALLHYSHVPPKYQHVYLIGAPRRFRTATSHQPGDETQANTPHYVEFVSALSAADFFARGQIDNEENELHFGNDVTIVGDPGQPVNQGVQWNTLPVLTNDREFIRRHLVAFTTFCYLYKNFLHRGFVDHKTYLNAPWYRDNFGLTLTLNTCRDSLIQLREFADSFLIWLHAIGVSGESAMGSLFRWETLLHNDVPLCAQYLGYLTDAETGSPKFASNGYDRILRRLDALSLEDAGTPDGAGLFIYLLQHAVYAFCEENYGWN
jgi:hypothetical protein